MAGQETKPLGQMEQVSEFGFNSEIERLGVISVLEQIRDSGPGNGNLTVDQVLHLIELDGIAQNLSKSIITPSKDILKPGLKIIEDPYPTDPEPDAQLTQAPIEPIAPPEIDTPVEIKRRTLRPSKVRTQVVFKDSKHVSRPPVPQMGSGPIARNVPPPPVRRPDPKE